MKPAAPQPFCRLHPRWHYLPCHWDFRYHHAARDYFMHFFREQYDRTLKLAVQQAHHQPDAPGASASARAAQCRRQFHAYLDQLLADMPTRTTILTIDYIRDNLLRAAGFHDPYYQVKHHDNEEVLSLLPAVCRDIDAHPEPSRLHSIIAGCLAGNIFDMGVAATAQRMLEKSLCFLHTRDHLPRRPWLVDDLNALTRRLLTRHPHRKAAIFVDNAGADFILGMVPLARYLAQRGTQVILIGNELPSLNDMTLADMQEIWPAILRAEPSLAPLPITLASSGTGEPLIDLRQVSPRLNHLCHDADLVILEGMGRALESNFCTRFDCDTLKLAMVKDQFVATWLDGHLYDVVCRFEPATC